MIDTAGVRTTYGSSIYAGHVPERTASCVERLEAAGAIVVGKSNLDEFAWGVTGQNPHFEIRLPFSMWTRPFNYVGWAALALGEVQLAAPRDETVLAAALAWERECGGFASSCSPEATRGNRSSAREH